ncbi:hypothetical protein GCM10007962_01300 [Yeosuana aromativorans]|uniref:Thioredoxin domain-containing protein n=1 Tax=Yeosuana aromativorans TaxID=288019 RepID=A0A8J3BD55_9FLAO|nr:TlpA disulfide reductase family protein [Yeosuana aromativorans]GGK10953.1 hypothetical protein GCM10007962_01300 [Yeosuana aromativorans]
MQEFEIRGTCDISEGKILLSRTSKEDYYNYSLDKDTIFIKNHKYIIKGRISYPQMFRLVVPNYFSSNYFLVTPGIQMFNINSQDDWDLQVLDNRFKNEAKHYIEKFEEVYQTRQLIFKKEEELYKLENDDERKKLDKYLDSLHLQNLKRADECLFTAIKEKSNSIYLLWILDRYLNIFGYKSIYENSFDALNPQIKDTQTGKLVKDKIFELKIFGIGKIFPIKEIDHKTILNSKNEKYFLIDFWFSNCVPCLEEFPKLKKIYKKYKSRGFEIIGISTDQTKYIENWKRVIDEKQLLWTQYLDENGIEAKKYNINYFPTNFLLDAEGKILRRNIKPSQLEEFLISKLYVNKK